MSSNLLKKGQIKLAESIGVLFIFFLLLGFGMIFFVQFQKSGIQDAHMEFSEMTSVELSQKISFMPELACTKNGVPEDDCFDIVKITAFTKLVSTPEYKDYYHQLFGDSKINITQIYPVKDTEWVIYEYTPPIDQQYSTWVTQVPVVLFNATTGDPDEKYFGLLEITIYVPVITG